MYSITVQNTSGEYVLHNSYDETLKLNNPVLNLELNKSGTLTFGINPDHPNRDQILPMASEIWVYEDDTVYWIGRPLSIEEDFDMMAEVTCEGILGYLLDTQMTPFDFTGNNSIKGTDCIRQFLSILINNHNARVGQGSNWQSQKRFYVGNVTVTDSNNNLARSSEDFKSTLETINEKLLETHGGFLRVRISGSTRYIDYIETFGAATQPILFGENLLDLSKHTNADSIYTCVIPLGAEIGDTGQRVDLANYSPPASIRSEIYRLTHGGAKTTSTATTTVPYRVGYIYDRRGFEKHGYIYVVQTWDDVTLQENLALKAAEYIGTVSVLGTMIELSAVDLSQISVDYAEFHIGEIAQVVSLPHDVQADYQITQMTIDLYNPANSSMVLGGELGTFTFENTKQTNEITNQITEEVSSAVQNATALLSGGLGGYLIIRQDDSGQPYEILIMNAATESAATNCVRINQNGIGFGKSAVGSTAWTYRSAWTIDGNLVADFITTGTLNANLIKAGILQDAAGNTQLNMVNGTLTMKKGSVNLGNGKFTVKDSGYMKAVSGEIGGMLISASALYKNFSTSGQKVAFGLYSATRLSSPVLYLECNGRPTFEVNANGLLYSAPVDNAGNWGTSYFDVTPSKITMSNSRSGASVDTENSGLFINTGRSTSAHSGNLYITGAGAAYYANEGSSSRKIKHDIKPVENDELDPKRLYDVEVIQYKYNDDFLSEDDPNRGKDLIGFIVEDLDEIYPAAVSKEDPEESKTWTWSPIRMIPGMLQLIQDQKKEIDSLRERLEKVESAIELLTKGAAN